VKQRNQPRQGGDREVSDTRLGSTAAQPVHTVSTSGSNIPIPDPTLLTTQLVKEALASFREVMEARLNGMDTATQLMTQDVLRVSFRETIEGRLAAMEGLREQEIAALKELVLDRIKGVLAVDQGRFDAIAIRFRERADAVARANVDAKVSLDAALAAAKEAVALQNEANSQAIAKSETATTKEIDGLKAIVAAQGKTLDDKITALTARVDRGEGTSSGAATVRTETRERSQWSTGLIVTVVLGASGLAASLFGTLVAVGLYVALHH
jgi:hypothetical protein